MKIVFIVGAFCLAFLLMPLMVVDTAKTSDWCRERGGTMARTMAGYECVQLLERAK